MSLIYMQQTIDYMARVNPHLLEQLSKYGVPEGPFELADDKGNTTHKYYMYKITE